MTALARQIDSSPTATLNEAGALALIDQAEQALELAETAEQAEDIWRKVATIEEAARRARLSSVVAIAMSRTKLRAERRWGELLPVAEHGGAREQVTASHLTEEQRDAERKARNAEAQAQRRARKLALVPQRVFDEYVDSGQAESAATRELIRDDVLTRTGVFRLAKEFVREGQRAENRGLVEHAPSLAAVGERFSTVVLDPPWDWGDEGDVDQMGRATPTYATMPIEELAEQPIGELAESNAHLYLWITNRSLPKGFALLEGWGFRYVTMLTWVKPSIGMGNYYRGSTEHVLFGVRGSLPLLRSDVGTHFAAARPAKHSQKPVEFYELVESCSPGPWFEWPARQTRGGWVVSGAEVAA